MAEALTITSLHNPKIKDLLQLIEKSKERRTRGLFVVEGLREVTRALAAGYPAETVFLCREILSEPPAVDPDKVFTVSREVYDRIAYRGGTEGIVAVLHTRERRLEELPLGEKPLILVLESVEKPGNIGAVLRSADAAGVDAVLVCDPLTDLYNPNLIRASLGAVFHCPVCCCTTEAAIAFLKARGLRILTAQLQDSAPYYGTDMKRGTALVMGSEAQGLGTAWRAAADAHVLIPMQGIVDSLNVSVSAAILLFEAVRQRAE